MIRSNLALKIRGLVYICCTCAKRCLKEATDATFHTEVVIYKNKPVNKLCLRHANILEKISNVNPRFPKHTKQQCYCSCAQFEKI